MNSTVKTIFIILISGGVFTLLLNLLKKNNPEIFYFIKKIPEPWKVQMVPCDGQCCGAKRPRCGAERPPFSLI